jgi:hypothetical protein
MAIMPLDVGWKGLRAAYADQRDSSGHLGNSTSAYLLLFYAVECGLKAELMNQRGLRGTDELESSERTHDLRHLAKLLNLPADVVGALRKYRRHIDAPGVPVGELHEAWRYGARLRADDESDAVSSLRRLSDWCHSSLGV